MPKDAMYKWDWPFTPVTALSCMGFNSTANGLKNQAPLPARWFFFKDGKGQLQKGVLTPKMGVPPRWNRNKDGSKGTWNKGRPGTYKDCCNYAIANGTHGPAVYEHDTQLCWTFEHFAPKDGLLDSRPSTTSQDLENVYPLWEEHATQKVIGDPRGAALEPPTKGQFTYMIPCGGEGMLPCLPLRCLGDAKGSDCSNGKTKDAASLWPRGYKSGCSQSGGANKDNGWKGTVPLFRTVSATPLPYSDDAEKTFQTCESQDWIEYFGYDPDGNYGGQQMPEFNPGVSDFKNARFIPWFDVM
jgi:hypothetical protein